MTQRLILIKLTATLTLLAQPPQPAKPLTPNDRPDAQTLSRTVQALRRSSPIHGDVAIQADKLMQDAVALLTIGQAGEARRKLAHAQALITSSPWEPKDEFLWSLAFHPRQVVMEPSHPLLVEVSQLYPAPYSSTGLRLRLALHTAGRDSKPIRELGLFDIPARDLIVDPCIAQFNLSTTPDGTYRLNAELIDDGKTLITLQQSIAVAEGIELRSSDVEQRLGKIKGFESAKASVRWPFDMARVVNTGIRKLETNDFGLPESGAQYFDFGKELRESNQILKALESGKDPLVRAKGDQERHYWFAEAGEIMPYRVYVPTNWDGKKQLPMIFVLHGTTRDHNFYFDRDGGLLAKLAEKYGYIVATTMGYRPNAGYNAGARTSAQRRDGDLSEKDAMQSLDLIVNEFHPDPSRIYLFGHSAGGTGGWYLGSKYGDRFAGLALSAFNTQPASVPFEKLKGVPLLVIVGSKDSPRTVETARTMAKAVAEKGFETQFLEVAEATHDTIVSLALPTVFQFFNTHHRQ